MSFQMFKSYIATTESSVFKYLKRYQKPVVFKYRVVIAIYLFLCIYIYIYIYNLGLFKYLAIAAYCLTRLINNNDWKAKNSTSIDKLPLVSFSMLLKSLNSI